MHFANAWLAGSRAQTHFQSHAPVNQWHHHLPQDLSNTWPLSWAILCTEAAPTDSHNWKMLDLQLAGFSLKPKFHCLKHLAYQLRKEIMSGKRFCLSPLAYNCEGNEDHVGRVCKLGRSVSTRTISKRVIERYFLKTKALIRRHQTSLKKKKEWKHEVGIVRWWEMIWSVWTKTFGERNRMKLLCPGMVAVALGRFFEA